MIRKSDSKFALLAGASLLTLGLSAPAAIAQEAEDEGSTRTLATVVVTTQKTEESIQDVPIAVSAFDEASIERLQLTGGADLVKAVPNVTFTKGNFTGSNFKIRGIGVDAVGVSADAGVGVHQNEVPLQSNFLFEAEYFDIERVEALRGPQGTLYGRNATGGVINVITAKPVLEEFQADVALTYGNFNTVKAKGMVNVPLGEVAALRVAGSLTQRDGFVENTFTGNDVDDRDLWAIRATLGFEPTDSFRGWASFEHFEEDDSRLRSGKQLCKKDPFKTDFLGVPITGPDVLYTSQGCVEAPLSDSFDRTNSAATLGGGLAITAGLLSGDANPIAASGDLREIQAAFDDRYQAEQNLFTLNLQFDLTDNLTLTSLTSYNETSLTSEADYNKVTDGLPFNATGAPLGNPALAGVYDALFPGGFVTDPQLGTSNGLVTYDISAADTEQTTQELRLQSDFDGPFNFNAGVIYAEFESNNLENINNSYYVLGNSLTAVAQLNNALGGAIFGGGLAGLTPLDTSNPGDGTDLSGAIDGSGRNYFRSVSPFNLESTALFGEGYFDVNDQLKLTLGLRYTDDQKSQLVVPSALFTPTGVLPVAGEPTNTLEVDFQEVTGRAGFDYSPNWGFTDDSLVYGFYSRGYKGGGINPPQPAGANLFPQTFEPEFINSYELGTKNTFAGGTQQLNVTGFLYNYEGYQITQIINRSSVNFNVDAELQGLEVEYLWTPADNWLLTANLGLLNAEVVDTVGIDVLDRTAGNSDFVVLKNAANYANCVVSAAGYATILGAIDGGILAPNSTAGLCVGAFAGTEASFGLGDVTFTNPDGTTTTIGALTPFEGIASNLDGNSLPGTPDMTLNLAAEYTFASVQGSNWDLTIRGDYYRQADSFSRVWNTGRDELPSWENINISLILANADNGWNVEAFAKNLTDEEVITGSYLTDDSSGLFTNIFLTEPALYGVTLRKRW